jgi:H+-transporting ATPase
MPSTRSTYRESDYREAPDYRTAPSQPKPEDKADKPKPEAKDKEQSNVTPQLVNRVHELYEELGRKDVQTVQDWEKSNPATGKTKSQK